MVCLLLASPNFAQSDTDSVNTRSVYHRLKVGQGDPDNLSLCPILDLANHHFDDVRATTSQVIPIFRSPAGISLKEGDEVFLKYGDHSNRFLFQHYGFVCGETMERSVEVDDVFDQVILSSMDPKSREVIESLLREHNYWR